MAESHRLRGLARLRGRKGWNLFGVVRAPEAELEGVKRKYQHAGRQHH